MEVMYDKSDEKTSYHFTFGSSRNSGIVVLTCGRKVTSTTNIPMCELKVDVKASIVGYEQLDLYSNKKVSDYIRNLDFTKFSEFVIKLGDIIRSNLNGMSSIDLDSDLKSFFTDMLSSSFNKATRSLGL